MAYKNLTNITWDAIYALVNANFTTQTPEDMTDMCQAIQALTNSLFSIKKPDFKRILTIFFDVAFDIEMYDEVINKIVRRLWKLGIASTVPEMVVNSTDADVLEAYNIFLGQNQQQEQRLQQEQEQRLQRLQQEQEQRINVLRRTHLEAQDQERRNYVTGETAEDRNDYYRTMFGDNYATLNFYDVIDMEDRTVRDYISGDPDNILFIIGTGNDAVIFASRRSLVSSQMALYDCDDESKKYISLTNLGYHGSAAANYDAVKMSVLRSGYQIFSLRPSGTNTGRLITHEIRHFGDTVVGGLHCQEGSGMPYYKIFIPPF